MKSYSLCISILLLATASASAKTWRGIEPLHSTRADVERLLGPPNFDKSSHMPGYDFPEERAFITYFAGGCEEGLPGGWNVPKDTVLKIYVSQRNWPKWSDVLTPGKEYKQVRAAHTPTLYYIDPQEGLMFTVQDRVVTAITYMPAEKDKALSCGEYKYAAPVAGAMLDSIEQYPFDTFGNIGFNDAKARLDNFVIQLFHMKETEPRSRGYIVVYAGRRARVGEAQYKANCLKNYLVRFRKMDPASLFAADGGFREKMAVELYLGRSDYYPPLLMPTVSPKKVNVVRRRLRNCAERSP